MLSTRSAYVVNKNVQSYLLFMFSNNNKKNISRHSHAGSRPVPLLTVLETEGQSNERTDRPTDQQTDRQSAR